MGVSTPKFYGGIVTGYEEIKEEYIRATILYGDKFFDAHQAHSVIREEFEEFWDEVKKKKHDPKRMREELVQIGAMILKALNSDFAGDERDQ